MKKAVLLLFITLSLTSLKAQKKLLTEINSVGTKEKINLKYNNKNQLIYFDEIGSVTYYEFILKYSKTTDQLTECIMNQDKGEFIQHAKYTYTNSDYVSEEVRNSGKKLRVKYTDNNNIYIDSDGRLTKTIFDDGKLWEEFEYDSNNNIIKYTLHSALGDSDVITSFKYSETKSIFSNIEDMPYWFWALQMNSMRWCGDFVGKNSPNEFTKDDPRFGTDTIEITYEYDSDGYPVKQYYDGKLVKEFSYKTIH